MREQDGSDTAIEGRPRVSLTAWMKAQMRAPSPSQTLLQSLIIPLLFAVSAFAALAIPFGWVPVASPLTLFRCSYVVLLAIAFLTWNLRDYFEPVCAYFWLFVLTTALGTSPTLQAAAGQHFELDRVGLCMLALHLQLVLAGAWLLKRRTSTRSVGTLLPRVVSAPGMELTGYLALLAGTFVTLILFVVVWRFVPLLVANSENVRVTAKAGLGLVVVPAWISLQLGSLIILASATLRRRAVLLGWFAVFFAATLLTSYGFRDRSMSLIIEAFVVFSAIRYGRIPVLRLAAIGLALFVLLGATSLMRWGLSIPQEGFARVLSSGLWRFSLVEIQNFQLLLWHYPSHSSFLYGKTFLIDFLALIPGHVSIEQHFGLTPHANSGVFLKEALGLQFSGAGITPTLPGELYVNFGWPGMLLGSIGFGMILQQISIRVRRFDTVSVAGASFYSMLVFYLAGMQGGLVGATLFVDVVPTIVMFLIVLLIAPRIADIRSKLPSFIPKPTSSVRKA